MSNASIQESVPTLRHLPLRRGTESSPVFDVSLRLTPAVQFISLIRECTAHVVPIVEVHRPGLVADDASRTTIG